MLFVGIDWGEQHHDVCVLDDAGAVLAARRLPDGLVGARVLHELVGDHADDPAEVVVGSETDRGLLIASAVAAGYQVYAINPLSVSRYRGRHTVSGAKSDRSDAKLLADIVRTDRHNHRPVAADSELLAAIKVLARSHQNLIWARRRLVNQLRSGLREFYPAAIEAFGANLEHPDALSVLAKAPTPELGRRLSTAQIRTALARGGRQRNLDRRTQQIREVLRTEQLQAPALIADAHGAVVAALVAPIAQLNIEIVRLEAKLAERFEQHPDAELLLGLPGLGKVLGARVLAEFGDAPNRYHDAKARRNYAGTAPITIASGNSEMVAARYIRNRRLFDACYQWAFCALTASPGARAYYDAHDPGPKTGKKARRRLANKLVGVLHGVLEHRAAYNEATAFTARTDQRTTAEAAAA